jgi:hypothetical protein
MLFFFLDHRKEDCRSPEQDALIPFIDEPGSDRREVPTSQPKSNRDLSGHS